MTSEAATAPAPLFHSPLGLFGFQADGVARTYWAWTQSSEPVRLALWDTGVGKTILALATAALCFEDDEVDVVVVVAEANKVLDWAKEDGPRFTDLDVRAYVGSLDRRRKILADLPQVLVMSWQTGRNDIGKFRPKGRSIIEPGILTEALKGKRVAFVFDEFSVLRSRTSKTYIAWEYLARALRKTEHQPKMLGLTATSVEKWPEDHFNACRILSPERAPSVADFYSRYVKSWDLYENPAEWKNLTPAECEPGVQPFNQVFAPITLRKRKTDPDVIEQFPSKMENPPTQVDLAEAQRSLYDQVEDLFSDPDLSEEERRQGFSLLRLLANHPAALLASRGKHAREVVRVLGEDALRAMEVTKIQAMLDWQQRMTTQQTVIFTFFGQSVLPLLHQALLSEGYSISVNHGGMSLPERQAAQDSYKAGDTQVFLSSDAGAKGLNLGCGSGLLHFELPVLYSTYDQRSNRIHRIDSRHPSVTIDSLLARDTLEYPMGLKMLKRNQWSEKVMDADYDDYAGDPGERFLRASDRLALMRRSR